MPAGVMMARLRMLYDGRLVLKIGLSACFGVDLSIEGLVTAMLWSSPAGKAGYGWNCMNFFYRLPLRSKMSAPGIAALAIAWKGF